MEEPSTNRTSEVGAGDGDDDDAHAPETTHLPTTSAERSPLPERKRRRFVPRLKTVVILLLLALPLAAAAGIAKATYDYSEEYDGRILPGATIAGVDVGGMSRQRAMKAVRRALKPQMEREVKVTWKDHT